MNFTCDRILFIITGFYPSPKILLVLYSCEQLLKIHTTYQSTYFIDYFMQDKFKNPRIKKIQQVHQKLQAKQFYYFVKIVFYLYYI